MKVIRLIETFYPNVTGPVNQAYGISYRLEQKGITSPIVTTTYNAQESVSEEHYKGVWVKRHRYWFKILQYIVSPSILGDLKKSDIIHAHNYRSFQTDIGFLYAALTGRPFVLNTHGGLLGYDNYLKSSIAKLPYRMYDFFTSKNVAKKASAVIVSSKHEYQEALRYGVAQDRIHIIPMGIDVAKYTIDRTKRRRKKLVLLFVGRISRNRNIKPLIEMMSELKKQGETAIELRIVGKEIVNSATDKQGYLFEMKELAKKCGVEKDVIFVGPKYGDDLITEYKDADVFVYTSLSENFGQTILEAAASGLALVCSKVGIVNDIVTDRKNGFVVSYDAQEIAKRIVELKNKKLRNELGAAIQKRVSREYGWDAIIAKYIHVYEDILKN